MATPRVSGNVTAVRELLAGMRERMLNLDPVMKAVAQDMRRLIDDSFKSSRSPDGTAWEPLAPSTLQRREAKQIKRSRGKAKAAAIAYRGTGLGIKPLIQTGALQNSVVTKSEKSSIVFGANVKYAAVHQLGTVRIPSRPYLPVFGSPGSMQLMTSGPAAVFAEKFVKRLKAYLLKAGPAQ